MGWVWRDDDDESKDSESFEMAGYRNSNPNSGLGDRCATRRVVQSRCNTEEVEPGRFIRKCEKTEHILRDCVGKPTELVQSNKEYSEEDVSDDVMKGSTFLGSSDMRPFELPGLRSDIEAFERSVRGGMTRFLEAADDMRNSFSRLLDDPSSFRRDSSSSSSRRGGIPIEGHIQKESKTYPKDYDNLDLAGLAKDV